MQHSRSFSAILVSNNLENDRSHHGHSLPVWSSSIRTSTAVPRSKPRVPPGRIINELAPARLMIIFDLSSPLGETTSFPPSIVSELLTKRVNGFAFGKS